MKSGHKVVKGPHGKGPIKLAGGGSLLGAGPSIRSAGASNGQALGKVSRSPAQNKLLGAIRSAKGSMPGKIMQPAMPAMPGMKKGGKVKDTDNDGMKKGGAVEPKLRCK